MSSKFKVQSSKFKVLRFTFYVLRFTSRSRALTFPAPILRRGGFTLLEVLVASAILSLMLAALYGVFAQTLQSKQLVQDEVSRARSARVVLLRIGEELQSSFPLTRSDTRFVGHTNYEGPVPEAVLSFVSLVATPLAGSGAMPRQIHYRLVPDPSRSLFFSLVRWENPGLQRQGQGDAQNTPNTRDTQNSLPDSGEAFPVLSEVRGFSVRFYDSQRWRDGWGHDDTRSQLPRAVELVLYLDNAGKDVAPFSTVVDLPLAGSQHVGKL